MAPPGVPALEENLDKQNQTSLLLSPFPSFSNCISRISVYSDHNHFFKNIDDSFKNASPGSWSTEDCFDIDIPSGNNGEVMTPCKDSSSSSGSPCPLSNGDGTAEVNDDVFHDVTLDRRPDTPVSCDTDFFQGLDDLDFDFDDSEPSRGIPLGNFIDATLEDTMETSLSDNDNSDDFEEENEDVYKKEFFLKHFRLQRVSPESTTPTKKSRKRKYEESDSNYSEFICPLGSPRPEVFSPHHHSHSNATFTKRNAATNNVSPLQDNSVLTPLSVPSKLCACASNDWKRTILYSTAKSSDVTSVQTSPSTASVSGRPSYRGLPGCVPRCHTDSSFYPSDEGRLSPSLLLSSKSKDRFEFDLLDKNEMDEDTKDLLKWLDEQETQTTIAGMTTSHSRTPSSVSSRSASSDSDYSSSSNDVITVDDLDAILSPKTQQSSWEMDRFQDLEAYVSDELSPTKENKCKIVTEFPKSQIPLSILADISKDFLNFEYRARKEAIKKDILKSCQSSDVSSHSTNGHRSSNNKWSNFSSDFWNDSPLSTMSSLSSSPSSSPPHSPSEWSPSSQCVVPTTQSKNLDLLNLFSDENTAWCL